MPSCWGAAAVPRRRYIDVAHGRVGTELRADVLPRSTARSAPSSLTSVGQSDSRTVGQWVPVRTETRLVKEGLRYAHGSTEIHFARFGARRRVSVRQSDRPTVGRIVGTNAHATPYVRTRGAARHT